jgi:hypothetical protein
VQPHPSHQQLYCYDCLCKCHFVLASIHQNWVQQTSNHINHQWKGL